MKQKLTLPNILRVLAVITFVVGALVGYDVGDKMVAVGEIITYQFDVWLALFSWLVAFSFGMLFIGVARIIDLLEKR